MRACVPLMPWLNVQLSNKQTNKQTDAVAHESLSIADNNNEHEWWGSGNGDNEYQGISEDIL